MRALELGHLFHSTLAGPSDDMQRQLQWRHPLMPAAQELLDSIDGSAAHVLGEPNLEHGVRGKQHQALRFHTRRQYPNLLEFLPKINVGQVITDFMLVSYSSVSACAHGIRRYKPPIILTWSKRFPNFVYSRTIFTFCTVFSCQLRLEN